MDFVEPIRDRRKVANIKNMLHGQGRFRDLLLFTIGVNSALRVSDLLQIRVGQLVDDQGQPVDRFVIREEKRGKRNVVYINESVLHALTMFLAANPGIAADPDHFVFFNTRTNDYSKPITRKQAWAIVAQLCQDVGLRGNYGTHTLRKTWAYHARMSGMELHLIMDKLNHNSLAATRRYLGITDDELEDATRRLNL